jgi:carboxyl-terminal processing protease
LNTKTGFRGEDLDFIKLKSFVAGCLLLVLAGCLGPANSEPEMVDMVVPTPKLSVATSVDVSPEMLGDGEHPVAQVDAEKVKEGEEAEKKEEPKRDYSKVLEDPSELGFEPDDALFRNVYYYIKKSFVEDIPEEQLFEGVKSEVRDLLEQAEVPTDELETLDRGKKVLPQLKRRFGDKVDENLLTFAAILGMLDGLEDRYSLLMLPDDYAKLQEQMQNTEFGGVGIYIELNPDDENRLTVFEPIEGTPAYEAGLMPGDKVMAIDGESTDGITLQQAQSKIRGPVGTEVILTVTRKGVEGTEDYPVVRGKIHVVSVSSKMLDEEVGYVRLRLFGATTADEMREAIDKLKAKGADSLVLDLRNNGGGYVDASVDVVSQFLSKDNGLVVYTIDRNNRRREYRADEGGTVDIPVLVLVNEFSASASEITAGALRDHGLAELLGVKSFGKGSVQQLYPFSDGSALKLTIAKFYTPSGYVINKQGLEPDIEVEMEPRYVGRGEKDTQLKKAMEILKSKKLSKGSKETDS